MKELIEGIFKKYKINLSKIQVDQFEKYYDYMLEENKKYNLTAITEKLQVIIKHFVDSVLAEKFIPQGASVIDVGSGAGFPGVPIKILRPDINIILLDSLRKRVNFLDNLIKILNLENIKAVHARAEDFAQDRRETFDISLSRAVAQVPTLSEYLLPFVKIGGKVIMYKGGDIDEELSQGEKAIHMFGGKIEKVEKFELKEVASKRSLIIINKKTATPSKFPRNKNLPKTSPIV